MAVTAAELHQGLLNHINPQKAEFFPKFFKTGPGQYGEGDKFLGVTVPDIRKVAKAGRGIWLGEIEKLLHSQWHEDRLLAVILLVMQFEKGDEQTQKTIYDFYLANTAYINSWDIVDSSARQIVGAHLYSDSEPAGSVLQKLAVSTSLWERRIAVIATFYWLMKGEGQPTQRIAVLLLEDTEDLMHKAVGWMLREMGKRVSADDLRTFLEEHAATMPRTMLRYAIEHFAPEERKMWLARRASAGVS
jgi:3-methyladenine DNA glycosylase AlkD